VAARHWISITNAHGRLGLTLLLENRELITTKSMESMRLAMVCLWGYYYGSSEDGYWC
jgi:hypothetical protein